MANKTYFTGTPVEEYENDIYAVQDSKNLVLFAAKQPLISQNSQPTIFAPMNALKFSGMTSL